MFTLRVKKDLNHPDGRIFLAGHEASALTKTETLDLVNAYPEHFEAGDELTANMLGEAQGTGGSVATSGALETKKTRKSNS